MIYDPEVKSYFKIKRKRISIWLDKDLISILKIFNCEQNKLFLEYELKSCLYKNNIILDNLFLPSYVELEHFNNYEEAILLLSNIILRMQQINQIINEMIEELEFIETYL